MGGPFDGVVQAANGLNSIAGAMYQREERDRALELDRFKLQAARDLRDNYAAVAKMPVYDGETYFKDDNTDPENSWNGYKTRQRWDANDPLANEKAALWDQMLYNAEGEYYKLRDANREAKFGTELAGTTQAILEDQGYEAAQAHVQTYAKTADPRLVQAATAPVFRDYNVNVASQWAKDTGNYQFFEGQDIAIPEPDPTDAAGQQEYTQAIARQQQAQRALANLDPETRAKLADQTRLDLDQARAVEKRRMEETYVQAENQFQASLYNGDLRQAETIFQQAAKAGLFTQSGQLEAWTDDLSRARKAMETGGADATDKSNRQASEDHLASFALQLRQPERVFSDTGAKAALDDWLARKIITLEDYQKGNQMIQNRDKTQDENQVEAFNYFKGQSAARSGAKPDLKDGDAVIARASRLYQNQYQALVQSRTKDGRTQPITPEENRKIMAAAWANATKETGVLQGLIREGTAPAMNRTLPEYGGTDYVKNTEALYQSGQMANLLEAGDSEAVKLQQNRAANDRRQLDQFVTKPGVSQLFESPQPIKEFDDIGGILGNTGRHVWAYIPRRKTGLEMPIQATVDGKPQEVGALLVTIQGGAILVWNEKSRQFLPLTTQALSLTGAVK